MILPQYNREPREKSLRNPNATVIIHTMISGEAMLESSVPGLQLLARGKVRDIYAVDDDHLLLVTTDRLSAYDVVLPNPVPMKGQTLTEISLHWFAMMADLVDNQLTDRDIGEIISDPALQRSLRNRSLLVKRLQPLPIEAVVRGYLIGSGWRDYQETGGTSGIQLPAGMQLAEKLPRTMFTPAYKAAAGGHDENISFDAVVDLIGAELAARVRDLSIAIYDRAATYALQRGIIIADTKFEFGLDNDGHLYLIDEVITPDSSRFWPVDEYEVGISPPSFDKQFVRDYLDTLDWDKTAPGPTLPENVMQKTSEKYQEALARLFA
jgi:phosphoribosylaminoimidazole-succinocarboxamide synthase